MTDATPMWDQDAERSVIGALIIDDSVVSDVSAIVQAGDFYFSAHRDVFAAALRLHSSSEPVDVVTLSNAVRAAGHTALVGEIAADVPSAANCEAYARIVSDWSRRRSVVTACQQAIQAAGKTSADELIADLGSRIEAASERSIGQSHDWKAVLGRLVDHIERAGKTGQDGVIGVRTHIPMLDRALSGLCPQRLVVVGARPSIGKSAFANQIAINAARDGVACGICSLEMDAEQIGGRGMAYHAQANVTRLMNGMDDALTAFTAGMQRGEPMNWPLYIDEDSYALTAIEAAITSWRRKHKIAFAVVDHAGLVEVPGNLSNNDRIGVVTRRLKKLAKRLNIAIVLLSQLNRALEKECRRPTLADLRDSGNVEQDADSCVFLHVDGDDLELQPVPVQIGFLKNRGGRRGWDQHRLMFDGARQTFTERTDDYDDLGGDI